jgi:hypothetical protein
MSPLLGHRLPLLTRPQKQNGVTHLTTRAQCGYQTSANATKTDVPSEAVINLWSPIRAFTKVA